MALAAEWLSRLQPHWPPPFWLSEPASQAWQLQTVQQRLQRVLCPQEHRLHSHERLYSTGVGIMITTLSKLRAELLLTKMATVDPHAGPFPPRHPLTRAFHTVALCCSSPEVQSSICATRTLNTKAANVSKNGMWWDHQQEPLSKSPTLLERQQTGPHRIDLGRRNVHRTGGAAQQDKRWAWVTGLSSVRIHQNLDESGQFHQNHFHQKPLSSKTIFIKTIFIKNHFHQNHFHQKTPNPKDLNLTDQNPEP